jgi:hypothetical protein
MFKSLKGKFSHKDKNTSDEQEQSSDPTTFDSGSDSTFSEDALVALQRYDTVFLLDDSTSMQGSNWSELKTAFRGCECDRSEMANVRSS